MWRPAFRFIATCACCWALPPGLRVSLKPVTLFFLRKISFRSMTYPLLPLIHLLAVNCNRDETACTTVVQRAIKLNFLFAYVLPGLFFQLIACTIITDSDIHSPLV